MGVKWEKRGERKPPLKMTPVLVAVLRYGALVQKAALLKTVAITKKEKGAWAGYYKVQQETAAQLRLIEQLVREHERND